MKKFMKNCAILALCFVLIGLVLTIVTGSYIGKTTLKETVANVFNQVVEFNREANAELEELDEEPTSAPETLESLDADTLTELSRELEGQIDEETMDRLKQAIQGILTEEELASLAKELNESLDMETKVELAGTLAENLNEEEMQNVLDSLGIVLDEETIDSWADGIEELFSENFWNSVEEAEFDIDDSIVFNDSYDVMYGDVDKMALGANITDLNLKVGGASLRVEESDDDQYYVEAEDVSKFQAYVEGECLYIKTLKASANTIDDSKVTLYVPAGIQLDSLWVELGAGKIVLENINAAKQDITVGAGQIILSDMQTKSMTVEVGMGELLATDVCVDTLNAGVGMGHMLLKGAINEEANIECAMGSVEMECQGTKDDFNYEIGGALGEVVIGNKQYAGVAQGQKINNNASKNMKLECAMGSLVIDF